MIDYDAACVFIATFCAALIGEGSQPKPKVDNSLPTPGRRGCGSSTMFCVAVVAAVMVLIVGLYIGQG